jgi:methylglutaconyl-CoA hydratase
MSAAPRLRLERGPDARVARVVLDRPDVHNAFDDVLIKELQKTFRALASDVSVRVVELRGEGKSFCAGADLNWMKRLAGFTLEENRRDSAELAQLFRALDEFDKPLVARVQGAAIGGGTGLAAVSDVVVAAEGALFGTTEVRLGVIPAVISPYVVRKIGESHARRWFLTGEKVDADEARRVGLVHIVVPAKELDKAVEKVVESLLLGGPEAQREAKRLARTVATMPQKDLLNLTVQKIGERRTSAEGQEGMKAFLEKRAASWTEKEKKG